MIRHLLKLVWHRKRANALITIEIFACFLIVFVVATFSVSLWSRWHAPLGFDWRNVWVMSVVSNVSHDVSGMHSTADVPAEMRTHAQQSADDVARLLRELKAFPQVEVAAAGAMTPYANRTWESVMEAGGRRVEVTGDNVTDDYVDPPQRRCPAREAGLRGPCRRPWGGSARHRRGVAP